MLKRWLFCPTPPPPPSHEEVIDAFKLLFYITTVLILTMHSSFENTTYKDHYNHNVRKILENYANFLEKYPYFIIFILLIR